MNITEMKLRMACAEALRLAKLDGLQEDGALYRGIQSLMQPNRGDRVPLDLSVVYTILNSIDESFDAVLDQPTPKHGLAKTTDVLDVWKESSRIYRNRFPKAGDVVIWQNYIHGKPSTSGHMGLIVEVDRSQTAKIIEGVVPNAFDLIKHKRQGIFLLERRLVSTDKMKIMGYISPWKEL